MEFTLKIMITVAPELLQLGTALTGMLKGAESPKTENRISTSEKPDSETGKPDSKTGKPDPEIEKPDTGYLLPPSSFPKNAPVEAEAAPERAVPKTETSKRTARRTEPPKQPEDSRETAPPVKTAAPETDGGEVAETENRTAAEADTGADEAEAPENGPRTYRIEDLRALAQKKSDEGKRSRVWDILKKFGADSLLKLDKKHYAEFMADLAEL
jgi:hypothetical protein